VKESVCLDIVPLYFDKIWDSIVKHYFDSEFICTLLMVCKNHYQVLSADDFAKKMLANKPEKKAPEFTSKKKLKMLHLTDMHVDLNYKV